MWYFIQIEYTAVLVNDKITFQPSSVCSAFRTNSEWWERSDQSHNSGRNCMYISLWAVRSCPLKKSIVWRNVRARTTRLRQTPLQSLGKTVIHPIFRWSERIFDGGAVTGGCAYYYYVTCSVTFVTNDRLLDDLWGSLWKRPGAVSWLTILRKRPGVVSWLTALRNLKQMPTTCCAVLMRSDLWSSFWWVATAKGSVITGGGVLITLLDTFLPLCLGWTKAFFSYPPHTDLICFTILGQ